MPQHQAELTSCALTTPAPNQPSGQEAENLPDRHAFPPGMRPVPSSSHGCFWKGKEEMPCDPGKALGVPRTDNTALLPQICRSPAFPVSRDDASMGISRRQKPVYVTPC